jgi:putative tail protein
MAQLGFSAAGAAASAVLGLGSGLGWLAGSFLGSVFSKKKKFDIETTRLKDLQKQHSNYGGVIPLLYGSYKFAGNVIWSSKIVEKSQIVRRTVRDQKVNVKEYSYFANLAIGLTQGVIGGVQRIWANDELIYDQSAGSKGIMQKYGGAIRIYRGDENQLPDPLIERYEGQGGTPAFRGLAYVVFESFPLENFNNHVPNFTFEVSSQLQEVFHVESLEVDELTLDRHLLSAGSPYLYAVTDSHITKIDRLNKQVVLSKNLQAELPKLGAYTPQILGHITEDSQSGQIYIFGNHYIHSFICILDPESLEIRANNFDHRIIGNEYVGIIHENNLYTADYLSGIIRAYDKQSLERLPWSIVSEDEDALHQRPGNFVVDRNEKIWITHHNTLKGDEFYLRQFDETGECTHYHISNYGLSYDPTIHMLFVTTSKGLVKINSENGSVLGFLPDVAGITYSFSTFNHQKSVNGSLWGFVGDKIFEIDTKDFFVLRQFSRLAWDKGLFGLSYDALLHGFWSTSNKLNVLLLDRYEEDFPKLNYVLGDILDKAKLHGHVIDVKNEYVRGYLISKPLSARRILEELYSAYFFVITENNEKIYIRNSSSDDLIAIDNEDLGASSEGDVAPLYEEKRLPVAELASSIHVQYLAQNRGYKQAIQKAERFQTNANQLSMALPLVLDDDKAKQIAEINLGLLWHKQTSLKLELPPKYLYLNMGDVVCLKGRKYFVESIEQGANNLLLLGLTPHMNDLFESTASGVSVPIQTETLHITQTKAFKLNLTFEDQPVILCGSSSPKWSGADLYSNATMIHRFTINQNATMGHVVEDHEDRLLIRLINAGHRLETIAVPDDFENLLFVEKEIIQFQDATKIDDHIFEVSNLRRGLFDTGEYQVVGREGKAVFLIERDKYFVISGDDSGLRLVTNGMQSAISAE